MSRQDVVIVGGGVVGLTLADSLTRRDPGLEVTVLEQHDWASGATGYAGAVDIPYAHTPFHRDLVRSGRRWWNELDTATLPRTPLPFTWLVRGPEAAAHLQDALLGPVRPVPEQADGAWRLPPGTRALAGQAHVIDPALLCAVLLDRLAARPGVRLVHHARVERAEPRPDGALAAVTADGRQWRADQCVLALGAWLPGFVADSAHWPSGFDVRTKRVFGLRVALSGRAAVQHGVGSAEDGIFLFPVADGEFAMSIKHDVWDVTPAESELPDEVLARAAGFLDVVAGPGTWRLTRTRVFADTYTRDATPHLVPLDAAGDLFAVTGLHGSGIRLAAGMAEHTAKAILRHRQEN
ncbi:FAD-binding oxidoreductase [Streptomyces sp. NBC_00377]|uniref:NAD(P)/FAD-dependent oxidoreductase n=1 Tax=unclassified Streptomyces TaxID=2593676 RepID=UPI002E21C8BE|nr:MULTISPECIES: FAD-dependent oxidoreductase [unclassified Streptomyces]